MVAAGRHVVLAVGGVHLDAEVAQGLQVRLDGAHAEVAPAGVGQLEALVEAAERAHEHDDRASPASGRLVHGAQVELVGTMQREVPAVGRPRDLDADAREHLEEPVDLLDVGDAPEHRAAAVEQARAQQGDGGVLAGAHPDGALQMGLPADAEVQGARVARHDEGRLEGVGDPVDHLEGQILVPGFDPVDRALAGVELGGQLVLRHAALLAGIADEASDVRGGRFLCHGDIITHA